jgi:ribonuclease HI
MKEVFIYTDGGCSNNQSSENHGGYGAILEYNGNFKEIFGSQKNTTNNRMEMTALIKALEAIKDPNITINVFSDSSYLIECFTKKWYVSWEKNGWKNSQKKSVENQDLWENLLLLVRKMNNVNFYRIKGHLNSSNLSEIKKWYQKFVEWNNIQDYDFYLHVVNMNNRADELANEGIKKIKE